jgi:hypothetical protein
METDLAYIKLLFQPNPELTTIFYSGFLAVFELLGNK